MRENVSTKGTIGEWMKIIRTAFANMGLIDIMKDPVYARVQARTAKGQTILVNLRRKDDTHVLLEFEASSPSLVNEFKSEAAYIVRNNQVTPVSTPKQNAARTAVSARPAQPSQPVQQQVPAYEPVVEQQPQVPAYQPDDDDFVENTAYIPNDTQTLNEYRKAADKEEMQSMRMKFDYYCNRLWLIYLMLVLVPPVGLFLLWYFKRMRFVSRIIVSVIVFLYMILIWISFFGIDTGFNKEFIQRFYTDMQYKITRFFNGTSATTTTSSLGVKYLGTRFGSGLL